jgi:hypothetical protein
MDKNFSLDEKSVIFSEDIRASINSLRDALEYVKQTASNDQYIENYNNNLDFLRSKLSKAEIVPTSSGSNNSKALLPSYIKTDEVYKQALFTV